MKRTLLPALLGGLALAAPICALGLDPNPDPTEKIIYHPQGEMIVPIFLLGSDPASASGFATESIPSADLQSYYELVDGARASHPSGACSFSLVDDIRHTSGSTPITVADVISNNPITAVVTVEARVPSWDFWAGIGNLVTTLHVRIDEVLVGGAEVTPGASMTFVIPEGSADIEGYELCTGLAQSSLAKGPLSTISNAISTDPGKTEQLLIVGHLDGFNTDHFIIPIGAVFPIVDGQVHHPPGFDLYVEDPVSLAYIRKFLSATKRGEK